MALATGWDPSRIPAASALPPYPIPDTDIPCNPDAGCTLSLTNYQPKGG